MFKVIILQSEWLTNILLKLGWKLQQVDKEDTPIYVLER